MAGFLSYSEAYTIAVTYGFCPPRKVGPARLRIQNTGKFEPDADESAATRVLLVANWTDKTNMLIQYTPAELVP